MKKLSMLLLLVVFVVAIAACANNNNDSGTTPTGNNQPAANDGAAPAPGTDSGTSIEIEPQVSDISGRVVFADYNWNDNINYDWLIEQFHELYPNIEVERVWATWNMAEWLTAQATAGDLPCVAIGWDNLTFYASQGWLHPLDEFVANDTDVQWIPEHLFDAYRFNGQLYAVPAWIQFNGIMINLDLLDQLNEDPPPYTWSMDEFARLANLATTTTHSGITWTNFDETFVGMFDPNLSIFAFNADTFRFEFTNPAFLAAANFNMSLRQVPGLFASHLQNWDLREAGELDDYQRKFGEGADALRDGLVLMAPVGTWDGWIRDLPFNFDVWPLPQDPAVGYTSPVHSDFGFMLSTAMYPEAAYAFLRFMTMSTEGWMQRLSMYRDFVVVEEDGSHTPSPRNVVPTSLHPDVQRFFAETTNLEPGFVYQQQNMDRGWRGDWQKSIPNFWDILEPFWPIREQIIDGELTPAAAAPEMYRLINANLERELEEFNRIMEQVQADFAASR